MSDPASNVYINELNGVALDDVEALEKAQKNYGNSWKKRGGIGAFMMLARKWDRLENYLAHPRDIIPPTPDEQPRPAFPPYDIFGAVMMDRRPEGLIDDIRDLRRYLLLVEAELRACGYCPDKLAKDVEDGVASKGGSTTGRRHVKPSCLDVFKEACKDLEDHAGGTALLRSILEKNKIVTPSMADEDGAKRALPAILAALEGIDQPSAEDLHPG